MDETPQAQNRRSRVALPAVIAGGVSALLLAFSMTPTFAAFTAAIQNTADTAGTGTLIMEEYDSTSTLKCSSGISATAATCADVNKYGGNLKMVPGQTVTTTLSIKNAGTVAASSFTLTGGACTQSNNGTTNGTSNDLCSKINVEIMSGTTSLYDGTAQGFNAQTINIVQLLGNTPIAADASVPISVAVTLDSSVGNTYEGLKVSQPMTWTFGA